MRLEEPYYAVIYPVLPNQVERVFDGKDVFCKYTGQRNVGVGEGTKILFYASRSGRKVFGEGTVSKTEFLTPDETISQYGTRLFITSKELDDYRGARSKDKKLLVITLDKIRRYKEPIILEKYVTMAGQRLAKEQYASLMSNR